MHHPAHYEIKDAIAHAREAALIAGRINLAPYLRAADHRAQIEEAERALRDAATALERAKAACGPALEVV